MKRSTFAVVGSLLAIQAAMLVYSAKVHSPTMDEPAHLAAGLSHWMTGRFDLYPVNPPLVRTVASAPVYFFGDASLDWDLYRSDPSMRSEFFLGRRLVETSGEDAFRYVFWARLALLPVALLGGVLCFLWGRDLFGAAAGLFALSLWVFSPTVLAYGALMTPDLSSAVAMLGASYAFARWMDEPRWPWAMVLASSIALAVLTKSVWLMLPPLFFSVWALRECVRWYRSRSAGCAEQSVGCSSWAGRLADFLPGLRSPFVQFASASLLAIVFVNGFYGFQGSFVPLRDFAFHSRALAGPASQQELAALRPRPECSDCEENGHRSAGIPGNRFEDGLLSRVPVLFPAAFVQGIDLQRRDFERGEYDPAWKSYLNGTWRQGGWWYYYVVGLLYKVPLPIWCLALAGVTYGAMRTGKRREWAQFAALWVPALALFLLVNGTTGFSRYVRYAIPVVPVLFILASQLAAPLGRSASPEHRKAARWAGPACAFGLAWLIGAALWHAPHHLSYFNAAAGGPQNGHLLLSDSNVDWGQDLGLLKKWLRSGAVDSSEPLHLAYFGSYDPRAIGIEYQLPLSLPPEAASHPVSAQQWYGPVPGLHVVSKNFVAGSTMPVPGGGSSIRFLHFDYPPFKYFEEFEPVHSIGHSMLVYRIGLDNANRVRSKLGLAKLRRKLPTNSQANERMYAANTSSVTDSRLPENTENRVNEK